MKNELGQGLIGLLIGAILLIVFIWAVVQVLD